MAGFKFIGIASLGNGFALGGAAIPQHAVNARAKLALKQAIPCLFAVIENKQADPLLAGNRKPNLRKSSKGIRRVLFEPGLVRACGELAWSQNSEILFVHCLGFPNRAWLIFLVGKDSENKRRVALQHRAFIVQHRAFET